MLNFKCTFFFRNGFNCELFHRRKVEPRLMSRTLGNCDKDHSKPMFRGGPFIKTWETFWTDPTSGSQALTAKVGTLRHLNVQ